MTASTHLAVGAAASVAVQRYLPNSSNSKKIFLGFVAGFAPHLLLDSFPHQEYGLEGLMLASVLFVEIAMTFFLFLSFRKSAVINLIVFFGMVGGAIPDFIYFFSRVFLNKSQSEDLTTIIHLFSHETAPLGFEVSIYIQMFLTLMALCFVNIKLAK